MCAGSGSVAPPASIPVGTLAAVRPRRAGRPTALAVGRGHHGWLHASTIRAFRLAGQSGKWIGQGPNVCVRTVGLDTNDALAVSIIRQANGTERQPALSKPGNAPRPQEAASGVGGPQPARDEDRCREGAGQCSSVGRDRVQRRVRPGARRGSSHPRAPGRFRTKRSTHNRRASKEAEVSLTGVPFATAGIGRREVQIIASRRYTACGSRGRGRENRHVPAWRGNVDRSASAHTGQGASASESLRPERSGYLIPSGHRDHVGAARCSSCLAVRGIERRQAPPTLAAGVQARVVKVFPCPLWSRGRSGCRRILERPFV
jgi:hypothetical protein